MIFYVKQKVFRAKNSQAELVDAANRYMAAGKKIPKEWVEEYNELSERYGEDGSKSE